MKIFISETDRQNARDVALKNIARFFRVHGWDSKPNDELEEEINALETPNVSNLKQSLQNYFKAYDEWFNFYQEKKAIEQQQEEEYILDSAEQSELQQLIENRERALAELQNEFDRLREQNLNEG